MYAIKVDQIKQAKGKCMVIIDLGWTGKFVLSKEDALKFIGVLERAEKYEEKWRKDEDGGTTHHVYPLTDMPTMKIMPETLYQLAKLAGKPEDK